jgi:hypothetical protein
MVPLAWIPLTLALAGWAETPTQPNALIPNDLPPSYQPPPLPVQKPTDLPIRLFPRISAGVTGFFGPMSNRSKAGPDWGAWLCGQAWGFLDLEAGYSGSVSELVTVPPGYHPPGPRYLRQGGQLNVGVTLGGTQVQPFVMLGLSLADYFTVGGGVTNLPVGFTVGLRMRFLDNHLLIDLRGMYVLESLQGAGILPTDTELTNRWSTTLGVGYVW